MPIPPSASLENASMPNAIHSFSSAASGVEPPAWPKFLLNCLVIFFSLRLLWKLTGLVVSSSCVTVNDIRAANRRLANPFRQYHPSLLLESLKRGFPIRIAIGSARQDLALSLALAREHEADRRAHAQLLEQQHALLMALLNVCDHQDQLCGTERQPAASSPIQRLL